MPHQPDEKVDGDGRRLGSQQPKRNVASSKSKYVHDALAKRARGGALTGNEERRLGAFALPPLTTGYVALGKPAAALETNIGAGKDTLQTPRSTAADGSGYTEGAAANVVGSDGKLNAMVKHSTWATPSAYPVELRSFDTSVTNKLNSSGIESSHSSFSLTFNPTTGILTITRASNSKKITLSVASIADDVTIDANGVKVVNASSGNYGQIANSGVITAFKSSGSLSCVIDPASLTHNMSIRTVTVCDAGVSKSMDIIASATY